MDVPSVLNGESLDFPDVLPGNYTIEIPAIPFLQNASEPTSIAVNSLPADGDSTITGNLGRLRPEYLSIRDFLRSTPRQSLLVARRPWSIRRVDVGIRGSGYRHQPDGRT